MEKYRRPLEKRKPFKLVKYFSLTSMVVILLSAFLLSAIISQRANKELLNRSKAYSQVVAKNLNHQVLLNFYIPTLVCYIRYNIRESNALASKSQYERLDRVVRNALHSFNIERVVIYKKDRDEVTYSTERELVHREGIGGHDYERAKHGEVFSQVITKGNLWTELIEGDAYRHLKTYIPITTRKGLLGVFELTQDISGEYRAILKLQGLIIFSSVGIMMLIFVTMTLVVRRGEKIIHRRAEIRRQLEAQLYQAERLAGLGRMVASVSHEIKNPLGIIRSTAELLSKKSEHPLEVQLSEVILEESIRLNRIVMEFLDFARPSEPRYGPASMEEVMERCLRFIGPELESKNIELIRDYSNETGEIQIDQDLIHRALLNLLINAIQAMPQGGTIRVSLYMADGTGKPQLTVSIDDTGPGISEESLKEIFEPFFTTKQKGTGLGLAIVKNIVEAHRGTIEVTSQEGGGARVTLTIPQSPPED